MNRFSRTFAFGILIVTVAVGGEPHLDQLGAVDPQTPWGALSGISGTATMQNVRISYLTSACQHCEALQNLLSPVRALVTT